MAGRGSGGGGGGAGERGSLKAKHYIFVVGGGAVLFVCLFVLLFRFVGFCFSFFPAMMNKQNIGSREKVSPCEYNILYPVKTLLKPRLFLPAIFIGN